jgi:hypothetical protein
VREKIDQEEGGGLTVTEVDEIMAQRGEVVCEAAGIEVSRASRFAWRSKMLAQVGLTVVEGAFFCSSFSPLIALLSAKLIPLLLAVPRPVKPSPPPCYAPACNLAVERRKAFNKKFTENLPLSLAKALSRGKKLRPGDKVKRRETEESVSDLITLFYNLATQLTAKHCFLLHPLAPFFVLTLLLSSTSLQSISSL